MAPFVPVNKVVRVSFLLTSANFKGGSRMFLQYTNGPPTAADCVDIANAVASAWQATLSQYTHNALSLSNVTVTDLQTDLGAVGVANVSYPGTAISTAPFPADVCTLIVHKILRHYRGGKPRTYLAGARIEDLATPKAWNVTHQANIQAGWGQFINNITIHTNAVSPLSHVNVSYKSGHMPNPSPGTWGPVNIPAPRATPMVNGIVAHSVSLLPASQARRLTAR